MQVFFPSRRSGGARNETAFRGGAVDVRHRRRVVIGAGLAGLAAAQQLQAAGLKPIVFDKADTVGAVWRRHYDRLHLHTPRSLSALPGLAMPASYGRYPSRAQFVEYLESYAAAFGLEPAFNTAVRAVRRAGQGWRVEAGADPVDSPIVVVATGWADFRHSPSWPGMQTFGGRILHSSVYRNATPFSGQRALVVGFGNSGAEIALDLCESGAAATLAVRSPVRVLPRDWLGLPIVGFSIVQRSLPARIADAINAPFRRRDRFADRPAPSDRHRRGARRQRGSATAARKTRLSRHSAEVVRANACSSPPMRPLSAA